MRTTTLTPLGDSLVPILASLARWSEQNLVASRLLAADRPGPTG
jgi:DNA-binding HxlR family transcriptional regulator